MNIRGKYLLKVMSYATTLFFLGFTLAHAQSTTSHARNPRNTWHSHSHNHPTSTGLNYTTNWIGNTYGGADANTEGTEATIDTLLHVPLDMNGIYATQDGKVYTNTPWEEGGRPVSVFKNGKLISPLDDGPNSQNWSNGGGVAVAADGPYIFRGNGPNGTGVTVLNASDMTQASVSLSGSATLDNAHGIFGMATANGNLYVTEDDQSVVDEFSLKDLSLVHSYSVPNPVRVAVDSKGGLWVSHRDETPLPALNGNVYDVNGQMGLATVDHYNSSGDLVNTITLPDQGEVGALWIDQHGFLLVGDDGPDQNIKVYGNLQQSPQLVFTLGVKGGDYAGGNGRGKESGSVGPLRFRGITGIATDARDNIYVSQSGFGMDMGVGHGAILQSYTWRGNLNWQVDGLGFVSLGMVDPHSQHDFYDAYHHFRLSYDKQGNIGTYVADTYDRFKYPDDVRVTSIASTGHIQYIDGKKFLLVGNQGGVFMEMDRFEPGSEIAIPCVAFDYGSFQQNQQDFDVEPLDGEFIWRDLNGDGRMSLDEFTEPASNSHRDGGDFWVDASGDVWQENYNSNFEGSIHLRRYQFQGFDSNGAPIYDFNHVTTYNAGTDFPTLNNIQRAKFFPNGSQGGTLYAAGNASAQQGTFTQIVRYDKWDQGNRQAKWTIDVPWDPDPSNTWQPNSFSVSGDYLFLDYYRPHVILVYKVKDGSYVGKFTPGADIGGVGRTVNGDFLSPVGDTDEWQGLSSFERPNGQYVVVNEEDYQAKQIAYAWKPENLPTPPIPAAPTGVVVTPNDEAVNVSWTASPNALTYNVYSSTTSGGPYTLLASGVYGTTSTAVPGLANGQTYYFVVSAMTETGPSPYSTQVAGAAVAQGTTYEAEAGQLVQGQIYSCPTCSGGSRVGYVIPGATITWANVTVPTTGTYAVRVYYGNGDSNPYTQDFSFMDITANGGASVQLPALPYTGDWAIPGYVTVDVPLNAGTNTVVLGVPAGGQNGAPDIDRIVVSFNPN